MQMVNVGFPERTRYGFEMVDASNRQREPASIENLQRIESVGFFANFRRFKLNAMSCVFGAGLDQDESARGELWKRGQRGRRGACVFFSVSQGFRVGGGAGVAAEEKVL